MGNSGLTVSTVGLGCASFGRRPEEIGRTFIDESRVKETIEAAIEEGITLFDTSAHGNEIDDAHIDFRTHPGSVVIPAAFAASQAAGEVNGDRLLVSIAAGCESPTRRDPL